MSRFNTTGFNPKTGETVDIAYGWDRVPGCKPGYFFQVYSRNRVDIEKCPSGDGILVNEGFLHGIEKNRLLELAKEWNCRIKKSV